MTTMAQHQQFASHGIQIGEHRVHYVDEGSGPPILFVHGSPTSSALCRHQIAALAGEFRVIAPDVLGFGQSSAPDSGTNFT